MDAPRGIVFDMEGVLHVGYEPLPGAVQRDQGWATTQLRYSLSASCGLLSSTASTTRWSASRRRLASHWARAPPPAGGAARPRVAQPTAVALPGETLVHEALIRIIGKRCQGAARGARRAARCAPVTTAPTTPR